MTERRTIVVTGAEGFVGKNLMLRLNELEGTRAIGIGRTSSANDWSAAIADASAIIHLAGVNRPANEADFLGNQTAAELLAEAVIESGRPIPIICTSSSRAVEDTPYGRSKRAAEDVLVQLGQRTSSPVHIFRLPNIFGKWCKPNYNSAVATFCHNVARDQPITIHDPTAPLTLVYVDDVIDAFLTLLHNPDATAGFHEVSPSYQTTVGAVASAISGFREDRAENLVADVGTGLARALYATYISYLPPDEFAYEIVAHRDQRGAFSEVLKTRNAGQFSFFTAHPGVTRGGHYHHTKTEKFLVVQGEALFRFRHMLTGEVHEIRTSDARPEIVETIPGWAHDITNVGETTLISLLWANELFDRSRPDTIAAKV